MWKPPSTGDCVDAATVMSGLKALEKSLLNLTNVVSGQRVAMSRIAGEQRVNRWMNMASVFVGVLSFVAMCFVAMWMNNA